MLILKKTYHHVDRESEFLLDDFDEKVFLYASLFVRLAPQEYKRIQVLLTLGQILGLALQLL